MTMASLFEGICRVFSPGYLKRKEPIDKLKYLVKIKNEDFNYIITDINNVTFYINRSINLKCMYIPFNIRGKECIFINIPTIDPNLPIMDQNQCIDIVYYNINMYAEDMFFNLTSRFFPNELYYVKQLYSWMATFKLAEKISMPIYNYDEKVQKITYSFMLDSLKPIVSEDLSTTIFDGDNEQNFKNWLSIVDNPTEILFDDYLFASVIKPKNFIN